MLLADPKTTGFALMVNGLSMECQAHPCQPSRVIKIIKMEYIDILDKKGNPTGEAKSRKEVHENGYWHRAVHIWIINSKNELLVQKRSPKKINNPNRWDISSAGHVESGGNPTDTALRELNEELGLKITADELEHVFTVKYQSILNEGAYINNEFDEVFLVLMDLDLSKINIQQEELTEVKFIHYKELEKNIKNGNKEFVLHRDEYKKLFTLLHQRYN